MRVGDEVRDARLAGGLLAVRQDADGHLCPVAGVQVREPDRFDQDLATWARLYREHPLVESPGGVHGDVVLGGRRFRSLSPDEVVRVRFPALPREPEVWLGLELHDGEWVGNRYGLAVRGPAGAWAIREDAAWSQHVECRDWQLATADELRLKRGDLVRGCLRSGDRRKPTPGSTA